MIVCAMLRQIQTRIWHGSEECWGGTSSASTSSPFYNQCEECPDSLGESLSARAPKSVSADTKYKRWHLLSSTLKSFYLIQIPLGILNFQGSSRFFRATFPSSKQQSSYNRIPTKQILCTVDVNIIRNPHQVEISINDNVHMLKRYTSRKMGIPVHLLSFAQRSGKEGTAWELRFLLFQPGPCWERFWEASWSHTFDFIDFRLKIWF